MTYFALLSVSKRKWATTGPGIGESPASHRRTVRSSRYSTSTANLRALNPEVSMALARSWGSVTGQRKQCAAGGDQHGLRINRATRPDRVRERLHKLPVRAPQVHAPVAVLQARKGPLSMDEADLFGCHLVAPVRVTDYTREHRAFALTGQGIVTNRSQTERDAA